MAATKRVLYVEKHRGFAFVEFELEEGEPTAKKARPNPQVYIKIGNKPAGRIQMVPLTAGEQAPARTARKLLAEQAEAEATGIRHH